MLDYDGDIQQLKIKFNEYKHCLKIFNKLANTESNPSSNDPKTKALFLKKTFNYLDTFIAAVEEQDEEWFNEHKKRLKIEAKKLLALSNKIEGDIEHCDHKYHDEYNLIKDRLIVIVSRLENLIQIFDNTPIIGAGSANISPSDNNTATPANISTDEEKLIIPPQPNPPMRIETDRVNDNINKCCCCRYCC